MDRGYTPKQFVGLFDAATADRQITRLFTSELGPLRKTRREGQGYAPTAASIKGILPLLTHLGLVARLSHTCYGVCHRL